MKIANILSIILGLVLLILSAQWIFFPESASESLNMIYLDGEGRNTQIRDFSALFWTTSMLCFLSLITKKYQWILSTGILFLSAAVFSVIASIYHNAPITYSSLSAELIFSSMAFISAYMFWINYK